MGEIANGEGVLWSLEIQSESAKASAKAAVHHGEDEEEDLFLISKNIWVAMDLNHRSLLILLRIFAPFSHTFPPIVEIPLKMPENWTWKNGKLYNEI